MTVSSRTPEGFPSHCPLCGVLTDIEYSDPLGDAACPNCGHLLLLSTSIFASLQNQVAEALGVNPDRITIDTSFDELGADSLDTVELIMDLEEEFEISIADDTAEKIQTIGDIIRYIDNHHRKND